MWEVEAVRQRERDARAERELGKFLDAHLYRELEKEGRFLPFQRTEDREEQLLGVDVAARTEGAQGAIDEKAQLHHIGQDLPTFAFELSFLRGEEVVPGWLLKEGLRTTHYLLLWPHARTTDLSQITEQDFTQVEGLVLEKGRLLAWLAGQGLDREALWARAQELRAQGASGRAKTGLPGLYYFVSPGYQECPVNLVIAKRRLEELAQAHYQIGPEGFIRLP